MINKLSIKQCCFTVWSVEKTESKNPKVVSTINGRIMLLSKCDKYQIYNWQVNLWKNLGFCYALLIFVVNMLGLLLWKIKKVLQLPILFRKF